MLPPIISTTPNSPTVCAKPSTVAVTNPGRASGSATLKKRSHGAARKVAAASSVRSGIASKACCSGWTTNGIEYSTEATTSPPKLNGSRPRPSACVSWPTGPCGPISSSR